MAFTIECDGVIVPGGQPHMMRNWECREVGTLADQAWQEVELTNMDFTMTVAESQTILAATLLLWAVAWGARQLFNLIVHPHERR